MPYATIIHGAICDSAIEEALPEIKRRIGKEISRLDVLTTIGSRKMLEERTLAASDVKALDYDTRIHNLAREVPRLYFEAIEKQQAQLNSESRRENKWKQ